MNKIFPLAFTFCLAFAGMQVSAENWIKNADGSPSWIDTDSIRQEQAISSLTCVWNPPISPSYPPWSSTPRKHLAHRRACHP